MRICLDQKWEDITEIFWETGQSEFEKHITQNGIILLKFFSCTYGGAKGATTKTGKYGC
jgi:polyphosphate kinase 2 (PPK2 family)